MFNINGRLATLKEMATAWLEKEHTGAMIALFVPKNTAKKIAVSGGLPPEELHVTLAYLGEANQIKDVGAIQRHLEKFANSHAPIKVKVGGIGKFSQVGEDGKQAFYLSVDSPELPDFRQSVMDGLNGIVDIPQEHGFTPHMTLKYVPANGRLPVKDAPDIEFTFDTISLGLGGVYYHYPLKGDARMDVNKLLKINGYVVTLGDLARAWVQTLAKTAFSDAPWSSPESKLEVGDFAKVCLIDLNEPGEEKVKGKLKLPIRSTPGGPVNKNALRAAAAVLAGARGGVNAPAEAKSKAARTLVRLMREADIEVGDSLLRMAGMETEKAEEVEKEWTGEIISKQDEKQIVYGVVLRPNVPDLQGDLYNEEEVEKAAHRFLVESRKADWMHEKELPQSEAVPVESYVALADFEMNGHKVLKGDWVLAMHVIDKEKWAAIKKGESNAFSIRGYGKRKPVES
jgi:2'-5' RNA ligase